MSDYRPNRRQVLAAGAAASLAAAVARWAGGAGAAGAASAMASDPADLTLVEVLALLEARSLSARELVDACIARVERLDPVVQAFLHETVDSLRPLSGRQRERFAAWVGRRFTRAAHDESSPVCQTGRIAACPCDVESLGRGPLLARLA